MSEEKKAIEILKYTRDKCRESGEGRIYFYRVEDLSNAIDTIINLLEKKQKDIEEIKDKIETKIESYIAIKKEIINCENEFCRASITYDIVRNDYCEKMLQSLLEEINEY